MILVIDTETTGREPPEVIELAYMNLDGEGQVRRFKPSIPSAFGAKAVHHILDAELEGAPGSASACLPGACTYIIGHNIDYDWKALGQPPIKRICTLAIARTVWPQQDSHSLGACIYAHWPEAEARTLVKEAHGAWADAYMCMLLYKRLTADYLVSSGKSSLTIQDIYSWSEACRIPSIISFGKHKGTPISSIPLDYRQWILRQPDMDPYLVKAVRESMGKR